MSLFGILLLLWIGGLVGFATCALFAHRAYERGYSDGWRDANQNSLARIGEEADWG